MSSIKTFNTFSKAYDDAHRTMIKAAALSLNQAAFKASEYAKEIIHKNFIIRNNFTANSVRYTKCQQANTVVNLASYTGILDRAEYMARQESGGTKRSSSGGNLIIPTVTARRGNPKNRVSASMYYSKIKSQIIPMASGHGSKKSNSVARAFVAKNTGGFVRYNNSVFKVTSFRKSGDAVSFKKKMVLNMKHKSTITPANPWLKPASEMAAREMQVFYNDAMNAL